MSTKQEDKWAHDERLKQAALIVMETFREEFNALEKDEKEFVGYFHDILFAINQSTDESDGEIAFNSTYDFPDTLETMAKAMRLYCRHYHILSCLRDWSRYNTPDTER